MDENGIRLISKYFDEFLKECDRQCAKEWKDNPTLYAIKHWDWPSEEYKAKFVATSIQRDLDNSLIVKLDQPKSLMNIYKK